MKDGKERFKYEDILKDIYFNVWDIEYEGLRIEFTEHASREITSLGLNHFEVLKILEEGFDCQRSKRKEYVREKCIIKRNKIIKVVAARKFNSFFNEDIWLIIHAGKFSLKRR